MPDRKESHRAAQEEFRRALTGEFEPVKAAPQPDLAADAEASGRVFAAAGKLAPAAAGESQAAPESAPESAAKRAVAARAERMRVQKKRQRRIVVIVAAALVALAVAVALAFTFLGSATGNSPLEGFFDDNAQAGQAPNKTPAELQAELNRIVEEGMFNISIASVIEFTGPEATGKAYIENVPNNPYDMTVDISLSETGESVYASKGIAPGNYIEDIQLTGALEPGSHEAVATFTAYDRETHAEKGKAAAEVTLLIGKGGDASG